MAGGRSFFAQYSVFCVFGSVVGCVIIPLITQSAETIIFSLIVVGLAVGHTRAQHPDTTGKVQKDHERRKARDPPQQSQSKVRRRPRQPPLHELTAEQIEQREEDLQRAEESRRVDEEKREEEKRERLRSKKQERRERKRQEKEKTEKENPSRNNYGTPTPRRSSHPPADAAQERQRMRSPSSPATTPSVLRRGQSPDPANAAAPSAQQSPSSSSFSQHPYAHASQELRQRTYAASRTSSISSTNSNSSSQSRSGGSSPTPVPAASGALRAAPAVTPGCPYSSVTSGVVRAPRSASTQSSASPRKAWAEVAPSMRANSPEAQGSWNKAHDQLKQLTVSTAATTTSSSTLSSSVTKSTTYTDGSRQIPAMTAKSLSARGSAHTSGAVSPSSSTTSVSSHGSHPSVKDVIENALQMIGVQLESSAAAPAPSGADPNMSNSSHGGATSVPTANAAPPVVEDAAPCLGAATIPAQSQRPTTLSATSQAPAQEMASLYKLNQRMEAGGAGAQRPVPVGTKDGGTRSSTGNLAPLRAPCGQGSASVPHTPTSGEATSPARLVTSGWGPEPLPMPWNVRPDPQAAFQQQQQQLLLQQHRQQQHQQPQHHQQQQQQHTQQLLAQQRHHHQQHLLQQQQQLQQHSQQPQPIPIPSSLANVRMNPLDVRSNSFPSQHHHHQPHHVHSQFHQQQPALSPQQQQQQQQPTHAQDQTQRMQLARRAMMRLAATQSAPSTPYSQTQSRPQSHGSPAVPVATVNPISHGMPPRQQHEQQQQQQQQQQQRARQQQFPAPTVAGLSYGAHPEKSPSGHASGSSAASAATAMVQNEAAQKLSLVQIPPPSQRLYSLFGDVAGMNDVFMAFQPSDDGNQEQPANW